jgi:hypothetical protein
LPHALLCWPPTICCTRFKCNLNSIFVAKTNHIAKFTNFIWVSMQAQPKYIMMQYTKCHSHIFTKQCFHNTTQIYHSSVYRSSIHIQIHNNGIVIHSLIFTNLVQTFQKCHMWCLSKLVSSKCFFNSLSCLRKAHLCVSLRFVWSDKNLIPLSWLRCLPFSYKLTTFVWRCSDAMII